MSSCQEKRTRQQVKMKYRHIQSGRYTSTVDYNSGCQSLAGEGILTVPNKTNDFFCHINLIYNTLSLIKHLKAKFYTFLNNCGL